MHRQDHCLVVLLAQEPSVLPGSPFQFDDTELDPVNQPGVSLNAIFSGNPVGLSQFGLEMVQIDRSPHAWYLGMAIFEYREPARDSS